MQYVFHEQFYAAGRDSIFTDVAGKIVLNIAAAREARDSGGITIFRGGIKIPSAEDVLVIRDTQGQDVAGIYRRLFRVGPTYEVTISGYDAATVSSRLLSRNACSVNLIGGSGVDLSGSVRDHDYTMLRGRLEVASVAHVAAPKAGFTIDIHGEENHVLLLAVVLALDLAMGPREES